MKNKLKNLILIFICGCFYLVFEITTRVIDNALIGILPGISKLSLMGYTSLWMILVGGLCGFLVGYLNQINWIRKHCNVFTQSILGSIIVLSIEMISGIILNIILHLNIWDYTHLPFNISGQISLQFGIYWFLLSPFIFWFDDMLRFTLYKQGNEYSLVDVYKLLFNPFAKSQFQNEVVK